MTSFSGKACREITNLQCVTEVPELHSGVGQDHLECLMTIRQCACAKSF